MTRSIALPEDLLLRAEELAKREHISVEELVSVAVAEQLAGWESVQRRRERATEQRFREALAQIPDAEPEPRDRL